MNSGVDLRQIRGFENRIKLLDRNLREQFFEACAKELAARLLSKVVKRTPAGVKPAYATSDALAKYWSGYEGGSLKRGWTGGKSMDAGVYARSLPVTYSAGIYTIIIRNPVGYASYWEYGHRQQAGRYVPQLGIKLKKNFVKGSKALTISEEELEKIAPGLLQKRLNSVLRSVFG